MPLLLLPVAAILLALLLIAIFYRLVRGARETRKAKRKAMRKAKEARRSDPPEGA